MSWTIHRYLSGSFHLSLHRPFRVTAVRQRSARRFQFVVKSGSMCFISKYCSYS